MKERRRQLAIPLVQIAARILTEMATLDEL